MGSLTWRGYNSDSEFLVTLTRLHLLILLFFIWESGRKERRQDDIDYPESLGLGMSGDHHPAPNNCG